ncbi:MAG: glycogen synthase GlgA [Bryobacteraceae bacterium]|nr:glycogen synthase GlgA [Bryobacteraceae bacterium]
MTKVLMVASEATPFAKTGGLADVIGSLPRALRAQGDEVAVVLPRYRSISLQGLQRVYNDLPVWLGSTGYPVTVYLARSADVPFYLIDCPSLYDRDGLYSSSGKDYPDNAIRFAVLSMAAISIVRHIFRPQVLHVHDWQASLVPVYLRRLFDLDPTFMGIRTLLTIHNLGYQGRFGREVLPQIGLDEGVWHPNGMEFYGDLNFLKGGIVYSDAVSTVSPRYAQEIQTPEFGFGLDGLLRLRSDVLTGIVNGVDYNEWNPETDELLPAKYSADDLSGKRLCKRELLKEFGLPVDHLDRPVIGIVSRFARQKGFDLIAQVADDIAAEDLSLIVLGTGEPQYEQMFRNLAWKYPQKVAVRVTYNNRLAHLIEAGSDMFLMPSRYEPCGLNQIYSLRYGTIPLVRATGGLDDTIEDGTGFKFWDYSGHAMLQMIRHALAVYKNRQEWLRMMRLAMQKDFSWDASAARYSALYASLTGFSASANTA